MKYLTHAQLSETLRMLADFYDSHPLVPVPQDFNYGWLRAYVHKGITPANSKDILRSVGSFTKAFEDERMLASVPVGHITLDIMVPRDEVCVRKVVGTRTVPAETVPSSYSPERVIPEHEEEIVEWECGSVLAPDGDPQTMVEGVEAQVAAAEQVAEAAAEEKAEVGTLATERLANGTYEDAILTDDQIPF